MPAYSCVDDRGAGALDRLRQSHRLVPTVAVGNQVDHGQTVDDDEILTHRFAGSCDDLDRQVHAL